MHRYVEHVGEVELELEAASEAGVFEAALTAFVDLVASGEEITGAQEPARHEVELEAADRALLLVEWLSELVYLAEVERFVPERTIAFELVDGRLQATLEGHRGHPRHLVKAVTLNRLRLEHEAGRWHGRLVLDV
jgi:SHS2 domain-containing protein